MKIISLNTWSGVVLEPLLEFFAAHRGVDVFCLQEIYRDAYGKDDAHPTLDMKFDIFERIEEVLQGTHVGYFRPSYEAHYGQALFIRKELQVDEEGDVFIYENHSPDKRGNHSRNLQYVRLSTPTGCVVIANVHGLWNGMGKTDTAERLEQSRRIREFVKGRTEQVVVVGDFNLNPDTRSLALAGEGMRNLVLEYGVTSTRTSYYEKEGKFADYALVTPEVKVVEFKVLPDEVSDHAALYLEIT